MYYDEELPNGFQEADFEMRAFEEEAARIRHLESQGFCQHGHTQGWPTVAGFDELREQLAFRGMAEGDGKVLCLKCDEVVDDPFGRDYE